MSVLKVINTLPCKLQWRVFRIEKTDAFEVTGRSRKQGPLSVSLKSWHWNRCIWELRSNHHLHRDGGDIVWVSGPGFRSDLQKSRVFTFHKPFTFCCLCLCHQCCRWIIDPRSSSTVFTFWLFILSPPEAVGLFGPGRLSRVAPGLRCQMCGEEAVLGRRAAAQAARQAAASRLGSEDQALPEPGDPDQLHPQRAVSCSQNCSPLSRWMIRWTLSICNRHFYKLQHVVEAKVTL